MRRHKLKDIRRIQDDIEHCKRNVSSVERQRDSPKAFIEENGEFYQSRRGLSHCRSVLREFSPISISVASSAIGSSFPGTEQPLETPSSGSSRRTAYLSVQNPPGIPKVNINAMTGKRKTNIIKE